MRLLYIFSFKISSALKVSYDFFPYIILTQVVAVGEKVFSFGQPHSQIIAPDPQDQTLRHFPDQTFIR